MLNKEKTYFRDKHLLQRHPLLQPRMRAILLDWLMEVSWPGRPRALPRALARLRLRGCGLTFSCCPACFLKRISEVSLPSRYFYVGILPFLLVTPGSALTDVL